MTAGKSSLASIALARVLDCTEHEAERVLALHLDLMHETLAQIRKNPTRGTTTTEDT